MATFTGSDDLRDATFTSVDLRGARFVAVDLSDVVIRGSEIERGEIDSPWLVESGGPLLVNGVDVVPYVDAELNRRFPGRDRRRAGDPDGLRAAWAALEAAWVSTLARVERMPAGTVEVSVAGEWTFAQTLRHLVLATDLWLGQAVLGSQHPFHPFGLAHAGAERHGLDVSVFATDPPTYAEVLEARASRVATVRDFVAAVTAEQLAEARRNPWAPDQPETVLGCLHTILEEEWEHHRYAVRDLDAISAGPSAEA